MPQPLDPKEIFLNALELEPEARAAFLAAECGRDAKVRERVDALLAAAAAAGPFLTSPLAGGEGDGERTGTQIGHYKLQQQIGEGGFGVVWMAEQTQPVRRQVALKVVKRGMNTRAVVARFEQERQALALMDHPNIAKVFDGGETKAGWPYFVMELVRGVPITQFCDHEHLDTSERLRLFVQVCHAVQHAHQKGVIHRDLKPSNVLVTLHDGVPVPKVIDFGIAKAVHRPLTEKTLFTEFQQMVGTPEYMSPEQAELSGLDIDTRADIYSLGVLLYELLTGSLPFDVRSHAKAGLLEMLRVIREEEPQKPSTRISTQGAVSTEAARRRRTDVRKLTRLLRGDLDWIVMRALEKDRSRRYVSANAFALDVQRHLRYEPVEAGRPGRLYRFAKYVRRHKIGVAAGTAVLAALVAGLSLALWGFLEASQERDQAVKAGMEAKAQTKVADAARAAAEIERSKTAAALIETQTARAEEARQRKLAEEQKAEAEAQRDKAEIIADFMSEMLRGAEPSVALGRDVTMLREMLDAAAARIEGGEMEDAPEAELRLRRTIGAAYCELAAFDRAGRMLEPVIELAHSLYEGDHIETVKAVTDLGCLLKARGQAARAESTFQEALAMTRRLFPGGDWNVANALNNLAQIHQDAGNLEEAERLSRESLAMSRRLATGDDPRLAVHLSNLACLLQERGALEDAERSSREALDMFKRLHPGDHPDTVGCLQNLAILAAIRGDFMEAVVLGRDGLDMCRRLYHDDNPHVSLALTNLGQFLLDAGQLADAEPLLRESLAMQRRLHPTEAHHDLATALNGLGGLLRAQKDLVGAEPILREALAVLKSLSPEDDLRVAISMSNLAAVVKAKGDLSEAKALHRDALAMARRLYPDGHPTVAQVLNSLAVVCYERREHVEAERLFRESATMVERIFGADHQDAALARYGLGTTLSALERFAAAEAELLAAEPVLAVLPDGELGLRARCRRALVELYEAWEKAEPGKGHAAKAAEWKARLAKGE